MGSAPDDFRGAMLDYEPNIVHFSGHGAGQDGIVLENSDGLAKPVTAEALKGLFELFPEVECLLSSFRLLIHGHDQWLDIGCTL